jgi:hypothetical protein
MLLQGPRNNKLYIALTKANVKIKIVLNAKACNITYSKLHLETQIFLNFRLSINAEKREEM